MYELCLLLFIAGNLSTGMSNDGFMEVNSGTVQQAKHLQLTHKVRGPNIQPEFQFRGILKFIIIILPLCG